MKKLLFVLCLVPAFAMGAAGKVKTLQPISNAKLDGLSGYVSFDMADSMDYSATQGNASSSGNYNSEKAFGFGAKYLLGQLESGIGLEVGGSYEMGRTINSFKRDGQTIQLPRKPEIQLWTMYGNAMAFLTQQIGVYGGVNWNIPQVKNTKGDWKGKLGYQFGATYIATANIAVDAEYRTLNMSGSDKDENEETVTIDNVRNQGLLFRGRYMF